MMIKKPGFTIVEQVDISDIDFERKTIHIRQSKYKKDCIVMYYDLLFAAVWNTLRSFGYSHFGNETGAVAVLHTWGQNLSLHPHIHCIVPAAGYSLDGKWKNIGHSWNYLYPVPTQRSL